LTRYVKDGRRDDSITGAVFRLLPTSHPHDTSAAFTGSSMEGAA